MSRTVERATLALNGEPVPIKCGWCEAVATWWLHDGPGWAGDQAVANWWLRNGPGLAGVEACACDDHVSLLRETEEHAVAPTKKLHVDCTIGIGLSGWPMRAMAEVEVPVKLDPDDWDAVLKYVLDSDGPVLREWDAGTEVLGVKVVQPEANR